MSIVRRDGVTETRLLRDVRAAERRALTARREGRAAWLTLVTLEPVRPSERLEAELSLLAEVQGGDR